MESRARFRTSRIDAMRSINILDHKLLILPSGRQVTLGIPVIPNEAVRGRLRLDGAMFPYIYFANVNVQVPNAAQPTYAILEDVVAIDAHGYQDENGVWRFADRQPVVDTILEFNTFARLNELPTIQVAVVCNGNPSSAKGKDLEKLAAAGILFTQSGKVIEESVVSRDGFVSMDLRTDGSFVNVDHAFFRSGGRHLSVIVENFPQDN